MKNCFTYFLLAFILLPLSSLYAQHTNIKISTIADPNETSVYINPGNTKQIIAGANINSCYISNDGGYTWNRKALSSTLGVWGDPVVIVDTAGYYYFFHLSNPANGNWIDRIVCQRSTDKGNTWSDGVGIGLNGNKVQDKPWAVVNPFNNEIYVTWTEFDKYGVSGSNYKSNILFSKTSNQGLTWTSPLRINEISGDCVDSSNTVEGAVPAVGPNGEIYVSWMGPAGLVFDRSYDGGNTWLEHDIQISDIPGGWAFNISGIMRCNGMPITCCDLSKGPHRGTIYVNWSDQRNGSFDTDVWLSKSNDNGNTWSTPIRVNDDPVGKQQFFTWMTIDQVTGYLWIVYYDRRNYDDNRTDVYMAVSKDGGNTFSNFPISESPFLPNQNVFFGDYTGIAAHNNVVRPVWTCLNGNSLSVWTAIIDTLYTNISEQENQLFAVEQSYPNPFKESTAFSFVIRRPAVVSLGVYNVLGTEIIQIINKQYLTAGKYIERFEPSAYNLSSGVYYFKLEVNGKLKEQKIVYLK